MTAVPTSPAAGSPADPLWLRYRATGDPETRAQLLGRYLGLVHHVAREIGARTPAMELDELVSAGTMGLVRALESFDLDRGVAFSTYAVPRIRGAILDDLRSRDWTPRSVRAKARRIAAAEHELCAKHGRRPSPAELAEALGVELATYWEWRSAVDTGACIPLDSVTAVGPRDTVALQETLADESSELPGARLEEDEAATGLRDLLATLSEKERTVLALYYYEELNLRQIAEVLHVTESRISQIRTAALRRLRTRLREEAA